MLIGLVSWLLALNGTPKCMKRRRKRRINMREQQYSLPGLDSTVAAEAEEQGEAKRRGMEEREATEAAASGMCGLPASFDLAIMLLQRHVLCQYIPATGSTEVWKDC
jgi:hypothetical protein